MTDGLTRLAAATTDGSRLTYLTPGPPGLPQGPSSAKEAAEVVAQGAGI